MKYLLIILLTLLVGCATIDPSSHSYTAEMVCQDGDVVHDDPTTFSMLRMVCMNGTGHWIAFTFPIK